MAATLVSEPLAIHQRPRILAIQPVGLGDRIQADDAMKNRYRGKSTYADQRLAELASEKPQKAPTPSKPLNPEALRIVRLSKGIVPDDELARTFRTSKKVIREA